LFYKFIVCSLKRKSTNHWQYLKMPPRITNTKRAHILIQCIGNRLRSDDGAGPAVADRLNQLGLPNGVRISEHWGEGTELMQEWETADRVILVDAAKSGVPTGTIHRFDVQTHTIPKNFCYYSTHRFGVAEAVELARALGRLPNLLYLYAIEGEDFSPGEMLSPAVSRAVDAVCAEIGDQVSDTAMPR
jgi:hydrogenase maturation protease